MFKKSQILDNIIFKSDPLATFGTLKRGGSPRLPKTGIRFPLSEQASRVGLYGKSPDTEEIFLEGPFAKNKCLCFLKCKVQIRGSSAGEQVQVENICTHAKQMNQYCRLLPVKIMCGLNKSLRRQRRLPCSSRMGSRLLALSNWVGFKWLFGSQIGRSLSRVEKSGIAITASENGLRCWLQGVRRIFSFPSFLPKGSLPPSP